MWRQSVLSGYFGVNAPRDATIIAECGRACNVARVEIVSRSVIRIESFLELTTPLPAKQITISLLLPLLREFLSTSIIVIKMAAFKTTLMSVF